MVAIRPFAALIVGAVAAVALSYMYRGADHGNAARTDSQAPLAAPPSTSIAERDGPATPAAGAAPSAERALAAQAELQGASESFRNTTLLIAIRDNGYVCGELTSVEQSGDPLGSWRVACRGALAYFVAVDRSGGLVVEPVPVGDNFLVRPSESVPQEQQPNPLTPPNR